MFRPTTTIRELTLEPGQSYAYVKTIGKITSSFVVRWCGNMLPYHRIISVILSRLKCKLPDYCRRPKHVAAILM
jgi:hypothetical protein